MATNLDMLLVQNAMGTGCKRDMLLFTMDNPLLYICQVTYMLARWYMLHRRCVCMFLLHKTFPLKCIRFISWIIELWDLNNAIKSCRSCMTSISVYSNMYVLFRRTNRHYDSSDLHFFVCQVSTNDTWRRCVPAFHEQMYGQTQPRWMGAHVPRR